MCALLCLSAVSDRVHNTFHLLTSASFVFVAGLTGTNVMDLHILLCRASS